MKKDGKPHIEKVREAVFGSWFCHINGFGSLGYTPAEAYSKWLRLNVRDRQWR